MEIKPSQEEVLTPFIRGKVQVIQSKSGYRFNVDSVLLAAFINIPDKPSRLIDLGTGSGIIPVLLSLKYKNVELYGVELQESLFAQAWKNFQLNKIKGQVFKGDIREIRRIFRPESFDYVVFNPPYHKPPDSVEHTEKNIARYELEGNIKDFIKAASYLLKNKGKLFMVFPSGRLSTVISLLLDKQIYPKRYRFIHPTLEEKATHFLLEAVKGANPEGEIIEKPLIMYKDPKNKIYTPEVEFILEKFTEE